MPYKMKLKQLLVSWSCLSFSLLILCPLTTWTIALAAEHETRFSYIEGSDNGPEKWGDLDEKWEKCKTGEKQSPINLPLRRVELAPPSQRIVKSYKPGKAKLKNSGHDIMVDWQEKNSNISIGGKVYILRQCHWHTPSEHTVNGRRFAMELHLVHQTTNNETAVIGQVYTIGRPDPFLAKLTEKIKAISGPTKEVDAGIVDPRDTQIGSNGHFQHYYRYKGSFTTPPCTEGVIWTVKPTPGTVSSEQVALLQQAVDEDARMNARPLQPLNRRMVHLYVDHLHGNHIEETL